MARKQVTGYVVRRPLVLWGKRRQIGEELTLTEIKSLGRIESLVRAGRISEIYTEQGEKVMRTRTGKLELTLPDEAALPSEPVTPVEVPPEKVIRPKKAPAKKAEPKEG